MATMAPIVCNSCCLPRTNLAVCSLDTTKVQYLFFQDHDGGIRYLHSNEKGVFTGGDKTTRIMVANNAKWYSPLAAVAYGVGCEDQHCPRGLKSPKIFLFYLNSENFMRCVTFDGTVWSADLEFNKALIRAHPSSKLAVIQEPRKTSSLILRLFYQCPEHGLRECIYSGAAGWIKETLSITSDILLGSYLAASVVLDEEDGKGSRQMWICYQMKSTGYFTVAQKSLDKSSTWKVEHNTFSNGSLYPYATVATAYIPQTDLKEVPSYVFLLGGEGAPTQFSTDGSYGASVKVSLRNSGGFPIMVALTYLENKQYRIRLFYQGNKAELLWADYNTGKQAVASGELSTPL